MNDVELAIRMTADASDAANAFDDVGTAALGAADDVDRATRDMDSSGDRMAAVGEGADAMASKSAQAAGGIGYVSKTTLPSDLIIAINEACAGRRYVSHLR